ncbi:hypothetical protein BJF93_20890 [Xaviernesmea oryzae]|uniref:DUF982 domain-containing protein n=1 Tax=Xaviernesmea oryzae TaxID=464029 RepID=A0A1Q9AZU1_9HYPH|nr:DUF982 domain-containing protein [Xaviernesmea oryzae]OLP61246.1 hypothetical protein BJF93_20890 [Xaviernesmea oryzae]SEL51850.1 Protein of unknown function [Xaviernesmea oryzae]
MSYKSFPNPVRVLARQSQETIISTAWDAAEFLRRWPGTRGRAYRVAVQHCLDALDGIRPAKAAYRSFTAAAREAGILA